MTMRVTVDAELPSQVDTEEAKRWLTEAIDNHRTVPAEVDGVTVWLQPVRTRTDLPERVRLESELKQAISDAEDKRRLITELEGQLWDLIQQATSDTDKERLEGQIRELIQMAEAQGQQLNEAIRQRDAAKAQLRDVYKLATEATELLADQKD